MTHEICLSLSNVSHAYGNFVAARQVDLEIRTGEVHCLLGPSGSGKSTLLRLVAGLEHLQSGSIRIGDREVAGHGRHIKPEDRAVGFVFQDYALFPHLNVLKNVVFGMPKADPASRRGSALRLLEQVGMADYASAMPHTLSGGQQQRVALARALARQPEIMLLDEPFSGLDSRLREEVRDVTLGILQQTNVATLMVTHDPREAMVAGDRISLIREGRIVQSGTPEEVYHRSTSAEVAETFGPINRISGTVEHGGVDSPLGRMSTDLPEGLAVELLIRPESLHLEPLGPEDNAKQVAAEVISTTEEAGVQSVGLSIEGRLKLQALALAQSPWQVGDQIAVSLDPQEVMICRRV